MLATGLMFSDVAGLIATDDQTELEAKRVAMRNQKNVNMMLVMEDDFRILLLVAGRRCDLRKGSQALIYALASSAAISAMELAASRIEEG